MKYTEYAIEDFASDEFFTQWVKNPTKESKEFWENWILENPGKKMVIEEAKKIVLLMSFKQTQPSEETIERIFSRIDTTLAEEPVEKKILNIRSVYTKIPLMKVAAAFIVVVFCSILGYWIISHNNSQLVATQYNETKTIVLPDSSIVHLNANTVLKFKGSWQADEVREVWLNGEAFFIVDHKLNNQKFVVHTKSMNIQVIGTRFNVNNRRNNVQVVLNSGKVKLELHSKNRKDITMKPGELVELVDSGEFHRKAVDPAIYSAWKDQQLVFVATPIREIVRVLEDNYGYKMVISDPAILGYQFTGSTPSKEVNILLKTLAEAFDISITKKGNNLVFKKNKIN